MNAAKLAKFLQDAYADPSGAGKTLIYHAAWLCEPRALLWLQRTLTTVALSRNLAGPAVPPAGPGEPG